ncbi:suppressor of fused domain protein [Anaerobiospirillum succiniciproducens]|uniref:suppressor of fused domain protein n=1 Tax=Anaerobiospirillum succiniciproducens TaxID=13335 RepID=UPI002942A519|nr:suppressor of fused domain protein [Anaerobiospirillum succiniciproducens]
MEQAAKAQMLQKVKELYEADAYAGIMDLLEPLLDDIDYELALELARAYINAGNAIESSSAEAVGLAGSAEDLYMNANALLDRFAGDGKEHSTYLFYKGYALFKLGLSADAQMRFERALRFIKFGSEDKLLPTIQRMLTLCKTLDPDNHEISLSKQDEAIIDEHIKKNFGTYKILFKTDRYELLNIAPTEEHPFNLIITKGVSGRKLNVPAGVDDLTNSRIELAICLPKEWEFSNSESYNLWPINTLCELINYILTTDEFVGFGYTFNQNRTLHSSTDFTGGMLTALGAYDKNVQEVTLSDNSLVRFFELVLLFPMELAFRKNHDAAALLEVFALKGVVPSPVRKRMDVCIEAAPVVEKV